MRLDPLLQELLPSFAVEAEEIAQSLQAGLVEARARDLGRRPAQDLRWPGARSPHAQGHFRHARPRAPGPACPPDGGSAEPLSQGAQPHAPRAGRRAAARRRPFHPQHQGLRHRAGRRAAAAAHPADAAATANAPRFPRGQRGRAVAAGDPRRAVGAAGGSSSPARGRDSRRARGPPDQRRRACPSSSRAAGASTPARCSR